MDLLESSVLVSGTPFVCRVSTVCQDTPCDLPRAALDPRGREIPAETGRDRERLEDTIDRERSREAAGGSV